MLSLQRQKQLLEYIIHKRSAQVTELGSTFGISLSTVRRDLKEMQDNGLVRRVHGGVIVADVLNESPLLQRAAQQHSHKARIGQAAAALVQNGSTIILASGTTTAAMLPFLQHKTGLTVITNSLHIAYHLGNYAGIAVVVLGGWLRHSELSLLGHMTVQALHDLRADQIFYGTFGIDLEHGLTGAYVQEAEIDRRIIAAAQDVIVLADHSKFQQRGSVRLVPISAIATVITDADAPADVLHAIRDRGIQVIQA